MQPPDGCRSRYTYGKPTVIPSVDTNVNGLRVAILRKFGVGHGEHFLDVHWGYSSNHPSGVVL